MGRTKENESAQMPRPVVTGFRCVVVGAPGYQPAHTVSDDGQLVNRHRPPIKEGFKQRGERSPIVRDVQSTVVVQVNRRVAEVASQGGWVVVSVALPLQIVQTETTSPTSQRFVSARAHPSNRV